jgi:hypothetical protein
MVRVAYILLYFTYSILYYKTAYFYNSTSKTNFGFFKFYTFSLESRKKIRSIKHIHVNQLDQIIHGFETYFDICLTMHH